MQLRQFEHAEADVERLVDHGAQLPHLDSCQGLVEDTKAEAVRLLRQLLTLLVRRDELDVRALFLVLARLAVDGVIHQFEELLLEVVLGDCAKGRVLVDVRLEPPRLSEGQYPVERSKLHAVLQVELQVQIVDEVVALHQVRDELQVSRSNARCGSE